MNNNKSAIQKFYQDQVIFITGGTGFVGKVLIEKLLRTCDLKKIYLLVRPKKDKTPEERLQDLFSLPCFEKLNSQNKEYRSKVELIIGDCAKRNLGLTEEDVNLLIQEVTIVIHAAADVKFNQPLRTAATNLLCTIDVFILAKRMEKLKGFVYISTAFSNCIHSHIKEEFYEPPMRAENFLQMVSALNDDALEVVAPRILKTWPNTYVYTKCIIEDYIKRMKGGLPIAIVRPAIICNSVAEPMPGWIDNFYGVIGISIGAGLGVIKSIHAKLDAIVQAVPVDFVANQILAAAWAIERDNEKIVIYNYTTLKTKAINIKSFLDYLIVHMRALGFAKQIRACTFEITESKLWHDIRIFFLHTCFSYFADLILFCIGRKPIAVKNYQKINQQLDLTSYFVTRDWNFDDDNVHNLWKSMSSEDKELFNFDIDSVDINKSFKAAVIGARLYLMKDPLETVPQALRRQKILMAIHYLSVIFFCYLGYKLVRIVIEIFMSN